MIDLEGVAPGLYFLTAEGAGVRSLQRIIVQ
jgi:hypothetical protein